MVMITSTGYGDAPWRRLVSEHEMDRSRCVQRREDLLPGSTTNGFTPLLAQIDGGSPDRQKRRLKALSLGPTLGLLVDTLARQLICDGVSHATSAVTAEGQEADRDLSGLWAPWDRAGMSTRQTALYREALIDGEAYVVALPSSRGFRLAPMPLSRVACDWGVDPSAEWPEAAALLDEDGEPWLYVDAHAYVDPETTEVVATHEAGVCPVVRYAPYMDLSGRCESLVDRLRIPARRHVKTVYDRLLIQHNNSWRVKTATGLDDPGSLEEANRQKALLEHGSVLTGGDGVAFGSLPETSMQSVLEAERYDLSTLAALASVPSWALSGSQLVNLSADALAEAKSAERTHIQALQTAFGRSHASLLRLAAMLNGDYEAASDYGLRLDWRDTEARSLSQAADALGKLSQSLGVPSELLWGRIPGVSPAEAEEWRRWAEQHPSELEAYAKALNDHEAGQSGSDNPAKAGLDNDGEE